MSSDDEAAVPTRRRWLVGLAAGAVGGVGLLIGGAIGLVPLLLFAVWALSRPGRSAAAAGIATGLGAGLLVVTLRAELACRPEDCVAPDLTAWYLVVLGVVGIGLAWSIGIAARARRV